MKHAILIIAHKNVDQLCNLLEVLKNEQLDIYVHLDKKWNLSNEQIEKIAHSNTQTSICSKRISGYLDTWSLCEIAIELMKMARRRGDYGYYYLISGQDYPIKPIKEIVKYLDEHYPKPIIDCTPMRKDNWIYSGFLWIRFLACYRLVEKITSNNYIKKALLLPTYSIQFLVTKICGSPLDRLTKVGCKLYGGSAWWALPQQIVDDCIYESEHKTEIIKAFKMKTTPEETFFQTIAMRSELKDLIEINDPYEVKQNCMTYAYFYDENHEPTGHPYILTENNFEMLKKRKELFARKFDNESVKLISMINDRILKK